MKFRTEVQIPEFPYKLDHHTPVLMMGSCFTDNIGLYLEKYLFDISVNPFGVIYNPLSIKRAIVALMEKEAYTESDLGFYNELYFSFDHYTKFSHPDKARALQNMNQSFLDAMRFIREGKYLIITFGTAYVFRYIETGNVVCNCHKMPASEFKRELLTPEQILDEYKALARSLQEINPDLKIIFTVSPVRHMKDGAHGNQVSKATLLLAIDRLCNLDPERFSYFPSYELVMDDLRDYRFYADDLTHPNEMALQYIWEKFALAFFSNETIQINRNLDPLISVLQHKSLHPDSVSYKKFLVHKEKTVAGLKANYPFLQWSKLEA